MTGLGLPLLVPNARLQTVVTLLICNYYIYSVVVMLCSLPVQVESAYFCSLIASADEYGVFVYDPEE